jgi:hypothetical protein
MRRWQLTGLVLGTAALFFTARPAQAQVWFGPPSAPLPSSLPLLSSLPLPSPPLPSWSDPAGEPGRTGKCGAPTVPSAAAGVVRHGDPGDAW